MSIKRWLATGLLSILCVACDGDAPADDAGPDSGRSDGGARPDAGADAGSMDAAVADAGHTDGGSVDSGPDDAGTLDSGPPDSGPPDAGLPTNLVFVTSTRVTAAMGGLAGADAICNARAAAAALPGTYVAWLSTDTVNAVDRLAGARGWLRTDGRVFADQVSDIVAGRIIHPIRLDEFGTAVSGPEAATWTATYEDGSRFPANTDCGGWATASAGDIANVGDATATAGSWTSVSQVVCNEQHHIYCFGSDYGTPVAARVEAGRYAFVDGVPFLANSGAATADAHCQASATAASLPGTYRAAIATVGATIASRFDLTGAPWVRVDGVRISATAAGLFADEYLDAPPNLAANGSYYYGNFGIWTGVGAAGDINAPGTLASTCQNWTSVSPSDLGAMGRANRVWSSQFASISPNTSCSFDNAYLLCLQE